MTPQKAKPFDVAKPGDTAADATARPLIVGHGSSLKQDPMVAGPPTVDSEKIGSNGTAMTHSAAAINPKTEQGDKKVAQVASEPNSSDAATVDALAEEIGAKKQNQKDDQTATKRQEELERVIASKQYFVPIGEAKRRRANHLAWTLLGAMLMVAGAGAYYLLNSGSH